VAEWFSQLQAAEAFWIQEAKKLEFPDFASTVLEYQSQSSSPPSETSEEAEDNVRGQPVPTGRKVVGGGRKPGTSEGLGLEIAKALGLEAKPWGVV